MTFVANSTPSRSPQTSCYSWDETLQSVLHPVSDTSDRSDEVPGLAQLAAKPLNVGVHRAGRPAIGLIPHRGQEGGST